MTGGGGERSRVVSLSLANARALCAAHGCRPVWMDRVECWTRDDFPLPAEIRAAVARLLSPARPGAVLVEIGDRWHRGRNDPCACGSGAKWKRCCGRPAGVPVRDGAAPLPAVLEDTDGRTLGRVEVRGE